jgi:hypothetical protein
MIGSSKTPAAATSTLIFVQCDLSFVDVFVYLDVPLFAIHVPLYYSYIQVISIHVNVVSRS